MCTTIGYIDIYSKVQYKSIIAIAITYAACNCGPTNNSAHCMCRCIAYTTKWVAWLSTYTGNDKCLAPGKGMATQD